MKFKLTVGIFSLILRLGVAQAQDTSSVGYSTSQAAAPGPPPQAVQPPTPAPDMQPPAPPQQPPAPPVQTQVQPSAASDAAASGASPGGGRGPVGLHE